MDEKKLIKHKFNPYLYSLIFSSSKGGFLLLSALLSFSGIVTGKTIRRLAEENISALSDFARDIPTLLIAMGLFFLTIRLISFFLEALSVSDMHMYEDEDFIFIKRGFLTKSFYRISRKNENIGYLLSTNSILFKKYYSLYAGIAGFGHSKYENSLVIPITDRTAVIREIAKIYKSNLSEQKRIFADKKAIGSYITKWFIMYIISCLLCSAFVSLNLLGNAFYIAFIPPLLFLFLIFLGVNKWRHSYVEINGETIAIYYTKCLKINKYVAECRKCVKLQIKQNIFQRRKGLADLCLYLRGNKNKKIRIRHIGIEKCMEIAEKP